MAVDIASKPVPNSSYEVAESNLKVMDNYINSTSGQVTNRAGKALTPLPVVQDYVNTLTDATAWIPVAGSFQAGGQVNSRTDVLLNTVNNSYYSWGGILPKIVPSGSTPETSGGLSLGGWVLRGDNSLRSQLAATDSTVLIAGIPAKDIAASTRLNTSITLEQFDSTAGTGGDDTVAFQQACALSWSSGNGIQLLNKTYQINAVSTVGPYYKIKSFLRGTGVNESKILLRTRLADAKTGLLLPFDAIDGVTFENFSYDCNLSDDPANWATGYDSFSGARGLFIYRSSNITIRNMIARNVCQAGFALYNVQNVLIEHCKTIRTRGNFGDGFYLSGKNMLIENCHAYDYTRIGYVLETNQEQPYITRNIQFNNCVSEWGHDMSLKYGGAEYNAGFWFENYIQAACYRCNTIRYGDRAFVVANSYPTTGTPTWDASIIPDMSRHFYTETTFDTCFVDGRDLITNNNAGYGFVISSLNSGLRPSVNISNCTGLDAGIFVYTAPAVDNRCKVTVDNSHCVLTDANFNNSTAAYLMHLGGEVTLKDCSIQYKALNQTAWDENPNINAYAPINEFGSDAGFDLTVENFKVFNADQTERALKMKLGNNQSRQRRKLVMKHCMVEQVENGFKTAYFENVVFTKIGTTFADSCKYIGCTILDTNGTGLGRNPIANTLPFGEILMDGCTVDMRASQGYLYLYNSANDTGTPNVKVMDTTFIKNVTAHGYMIRINADPSLTSTNGIHRFNFDGCSFINLSTTQTNTPIIYSDTIGNVDVFGTGNYKSGSLAVDAGPNTTNSAGNYFVNSKF